MLLCGVGCDGRLIVPSITRFSQQVKKPRGAFVAGGSIESALPIGAVDQLLACLDPKCTFAVSMLLRVQTAIPIGVIAPSTTPAPRSECIQAARVVSEGREAVLQRLLDLGDNARGAFVARGFVEDFIAQIALDAA